MPKNRAQKKETLDFLVDRIEKSKAAVFIGFQGSKVTETDELRNACRAEGLEYLAAKKTLLKKALEKLGLTVENPEVLANEIAIVLSNEDEVIAAKVVAKFAKTHEAIALKGGILEKKVIDLKKVKVLVNIPSKQELYAKIVGSINAPISGFVTVLKGNLRGLVQVLNQIKNQK